jgi:hypothetical protein
MIDGSVVTMNGHRKLFHEPTKVKIPTAERIGLDRGRITLHSTRRCPAPSMRAASS